MEKGLLVDFFGAIGASTGTCTCPGTTGTITVAVAGTAGAAGAALAWPGATTGGAT